MQSDGGGILPMRGEAGRSTEHGEGRAHPHSVMKQVGTGSQGATRQLGRPAQTVAQCPGAGSGSG